MEYDFRIEGIDEMEIAFRSLDDALERYIIGRGLFAMAKVVVKEVKQNVPVLSGALLSSARARRTGERFRGKKIPGGSAAVFVGGPKARHAALIELGTVKMAPNPFLAKSLIMSKSAQYSALVNATARELERQVRRIASGTQTRAVTRLITGG